MTLPNFLIIGAAKAGSTSLYNYLKQHPQIFMSSVKEPRYFASEYYTTYFKKSYRHSYSQDGMSRQDYEALFDNVRDEIAIGEASTEYLFFQKSAERISGVIPNAKIIAILRNPADRAFSAYCYHLRDGRETLPFKEALEKESLRIAQRWQAGWFYKAGGTYYEQLKRYYRHFDAQNIKVILWEDLNEDPQAVCSEVFDFLGVDSQFSPDLSRSNQSLLPKSAFLNRLIFKNSALKKPLKHLFPSFLYEVLTEPIKKKFYTSKKKMNPEVKQKMVEFYRDDVSKLESLLDINLTAWKS